MTFVSQNFRVFSRAMSLVPEVCPIPQNTSHTYETGFVACAEDERQRIRPDRGLESTVKDSTTRPYQSDQMNFTPLNANSKLSTIANGIDIESPKTSAQ